MDPRLCTRSVAFRAADDAGDGRTLRGYAAVFDQPTRIDSWEGRFDEIIAKGAFRKTLRERKPIMQWNHGFDPAVGQIPIGVYQRIEEDNHGLDVEGPLHDDPVAERVRIAIASGAVTGMSFKFRVIRDEWRDGKGKLIKDPQKLYQLIYSSQEPEDGIPTRTIKEIALYEAGPVSTPAYAQTTVGVRSRDQLAESERQEIISLYARNMDTEDDETVPRIDILEQPDIAAPKPVDMTAQPTQSPTSEVRDAAPSGTSPAKETPKPDAAPAGTSVREALPDNTSTTGKVKAMNLEALRARRAEIVKRATEIDTEHRDAALPEEAKTEFDALRSELTDVDASIAEIEERAAFAKSLAMTPGHVDKPVHKVAAPKSGERKQTPEFMEQRDDEDIFNLEDLSARSLSGAEFLRKVGDNAKYAIERAEYGVDDEDAARTHVEQMLKRVDTKEKVLAKRILLTGSEDYVSGFSKYLRHGSDAFCTTEERQALLRAQSLQGASGAEGGYAVPFQLDPTVILTSAGVYNPIRELARVETIVGRKWQGVISAGTTVTRGAEGATAPESDIDLAQPELDTNRVQGFVPFSIEIELAWGALLREITRCLIDAKQTEENSFITGDGVTGTQPGGVVGSLSGNTVTAGGVAAFAGSDVYAVQNALEPRWEPNASWLAHKAIYHRVRQFDTSGGGMFWGSLAGGNPNTLLDYPIAKSSAMASVLTTGSKILLHGDFNQFLIVDRIGMTVEMIPHVFDSAAGNRPKGQRGVYAYWMNNSKILVPSAFKLLVTG